MSQQRSQIELLKQLDQVCDEFEAQYESGARPSVFEFASQVDQTLREQAFEHLLRVEVSQRRENGEQPMLDDYLHNYPEHREIVQRVFQDLTSAEDTRDPDDTLDSSDESSISTGPLSLPDYELLEELGKGGMGVVYKARQNSLDRLVAIKLIHAGEFATPEQIERFTSEAKAAAKLQHPGIVGVFEVGQSEGQYYFSMEYVEGQTLESILRSGDVSPEKIVEYLKAVAEAIDFAHQQGVVHRDIKPSNILIDRFDRVRVMDFGLAKILDSDAGLTTSGQILGTPSYMSPEQARGEQSTIDHRTDVYALGAVLYRALSGKSVFESESAGETLAMIIRDVPRPLRQIKSEIDSELEKICSRCLEKNPSERFATAGEIVAALEEYTEKRQVIAPAGNKRKTNRVLIATAALVAFLVAAAVVVIKIGDKEITLKTDDNAEVEVGDDEVTVKTGDKTIRVKRDDSQEPRPKAKPVPVGASPFDLLQREDIDPYELAFAGDGDPAAAPEGLVAVLGEGLGRHTSTILDVGVSPDGTTVASVADGRVWLWDAQTMRQKAVWNLEQVWSVCFLADSTKLAALTSGAIFIWDVNAAPQLIAEVPLPEDTRFGGTFSSLAYANQTRTLSALTFDSSRDATVHLWKCDDQGVPIGDNIAVKIDEQIKFAAINPAGTLMAAGGGEGKVRLWKLGEQPQSWAELASDGAQAHKVAFSPNGQWLAVACGDKNCRVWDVSGDAPVEAFVLSAPAPHAYFSVTFSADSRQIACGAHGQIHLWNLAGAEPSQGVHVHSRAAGDNVYHIAFMPDGNSLVSADFDFLLRITDLTKRPPEPRLVPQGHRSRNAKVLHVCGDGKSVYTIANDSRVLRWKMVDGRFEMSGEALVNYKSEATVNHHGTLLAVGRGNSDVQLFTLEKDRIFMQRRLSAAGDVRLALSPDAKRLATIASDGQARLWDLSGGQTVLEQFHRAEGTPNFGLAFSPDGRLLAASGELNEGETVVHFWDVTKSPPERLKNLDIAGCPPVRALQFSADGNLLLQSGTQSVDVTDLSGNRPALVFRSNSNNIYGQPAAFSPDGKLIAMSIVKTGHRVELRDTKDFRLLREWSLPAPAELNFAPDSRHLLTGNTNGTVYVLRVKDLEVDQPVVRAEPPRAQAFMVDQLRREGIDPYELEFAGDGDPESAPNGLVAVLGESQGRHTRGIVDAAVSPDGKTIASVSSFDRVRVWDARTMQQKAVWNQRSTSVCFLANSTTLAVAKVGVLTIWDVSTAPQQIAEFPVDKSNPAGFYIGSLAYADQGRTLIAFPYHQSKDWTIRLWRCDEQGIPIGDSIAVEIDEQTKGAAINRAGTMLAAGSSEGKVWLWKLGGQPQSWAELAANGAEINEVAFSPNGKWLAAACGDKKCRVWDVSGDVPVEAIVLSAPAQLGYFSVAFSADNRQIACGVVGQQTHGQIHLWSLADGKPSQRVQFRSRTDVIAFTPDGNSLVSIAEHAGNLLQITDLTKRPPQPRLVPQGHAHSAGVLHVSDDGKTVCTVAGRRALIWKLVNGRFEVSGEEAVGGASTVNQQGTLLAVGREDSSIQLFNLTKGRIFQQRRLTAARGARLALSPDGKRLATIATDGQTRLWDLAGGQGIVLGKFQPVAMYDYKVAFSSDGSLLAASGELNKSETVIHFWDVTSSPPQRLKNLDITGCPPSRTLQFSPDGTLLLHTGSESVDVTDLSGDRPERVFSSNIRSAHNQHATFSPDGKLIAMSLGEKRHRVEVRDTKDFKVIHEWPLPGPVHLKFASDSDHLFIGNANGTVYMLRIDE